MEPCYEWTFDLYDDVDSPIPDGREPELPPLAKLCSDCTTVFGTYSKPEMYLYDQAYTLDQNFAQIEKAALDGCRLCSLQIEPFTKEELQRLRECTVVEYQFTLYNKLSEEWIVFTYLVQGRVVTTHALRMVTLKGKSNPPY